MSAPVEGSGCPKHAPWYVYLCPDCTAAWESRIDHEAIAKLDLALARGAEVRELRAAADRLRKMISCEENPESRCAKETPDPPDRLLHRCLQCQIALARAEASALRVERISLVSTAASKQARIEELISERNALERDLSAAYEELRPREET